MTDATITTLQDNLRKVFERSTARSSRRYSPRTPI